MHPLYLIPPSEGKQSGGMNTSRHLTFSFQYPDDLARHATEKDLKCTGKRYQEAMFLNNHRQQGPVLPAYERYSGVFYTALDYHTLTDEQQHKAQASIVIISGLFGLVGLGDHIPNYKLPIETKGLIPYRKPLLTKTLIERIQKKHITHLIDLLPSSYRRVVDWKQLQQHVQDIRIPTPEQDSLEKNTKTHMIKQRRGKRLRQHIQQSS